MAQLGALLVTHDEEFRRQVLHLARTSGVPVGIVDERRSADAGHIDVAIVDLRADAASAMAAIERLRAGYATVAIFAIAATTAPDLILQAMRAGANEFFAWPPPEDAFHGALRRTAARRESVQAANRQPTVTLVFFGAKGGAGTTTVAVNCAVDLAKSRRPTIIVDLKPSLGEVALFLGVRPRFTVVDAVDNLARLDKDFIREIVTRHKSGLEILAGSEQFDRPNAQDGGGLEELFRLLARTHDFIVIDAGNSLTATAIAALYAADQVYFVAEPDVPSVRNAQRLVDRVRQLGVGGERIRILLNRAGDSMLIAPKQIETALGYGIHWSFSNEPRVASTALNSGVPIALTNHSEISSQFDRFTRQILTPTEPQVEKVEPEPRKRGFLSLR